MSRINFYECHLGCYPVSGFSSAATLVNNEGKEFKISASLVENQVHHCHLMKVVVDIVPMENSGTAFIGDAQNYIFFEGDEVGNIWGNKADCNIHSMSGSDGVRWT